MVYAENTVTGIYGNKGDGKTVTTTLFLYTELIEKIRYPIFCNYKLTFDFKWLDAYELLTSWEKFKHSCIGIDELHDYADSRNSSSIQNRLISGWFLQSRHTSSNIYFSTQFPDQIDKRISRIVDIEIYCSNCYEDTDKDGIDDLFLLTIIDLRHRNVNDRYFYAKPIFELYDSSERINPFFVTKERQKEVMEILASKNYEKTKNQ